MARLIWAFSKVLGFLGFVSLPLAGMFALIIGGTCTPEACIWGIDVETWWAVLKTAAKIAFSMIFWSFMTAMVIGPEMEA